MRKQWLGLGLCTAVCVVFAACGSSGKPATDAPTAGATGSSGTGSGGSASGTGGAPAPGSGGSAAAGSSGAGGSSAALKGNQWPAAGPKCGSAGKLCSDGCDDSTICNLGNDLCLPLSSAAVSLICSPGACEDSEPYCVAGQCMTAEQASCTCAAAAARDRVDVCATGPDAARGSCIGDQQICAGAPDKCCSGLICLQAPGIIAQCFMPCVQNSDCTSGCCTDAGTGQTAQKVCGPAEVCGSGGAGTGGVAQRCAQAGEGCKDVPCCDAMSCFESDNPDFAGCRQTCTSAADCASHCCTPAGSAGICVAAEYCGEPCTSSAGCTSNCCVPGFPASDGNHCAPAKTCSGDACLEAGAGCGTGVCCEGLVCTGADKTSSTCKTRCKTSTDCTSGCCASITGTDQKECRSEGPAC
jgi:hypothetical protein